jgi:ATP-dependent Lon protease
MTLLAQHLLFFCVYRRMTTFIPLFPLGMVTFPGEQVNLHIFEPRYKQLIQECSDQGTTFGISPFIDRKLMHLGTEMELLSIEKTYTNGEMDVKTRGLGIYKMEEFYPKTRNKLYGGADITRLEIDTETDFFVNEQIMGFVEELFEVLTIRKPIPVIDSDFNVYKLGHLVGFNIEQEYEFLTIRNEYERQVFMLKHLERLLPIVREMHRLQERAKLNGHFRNIIPPNV